MKGILMSVVLVDVDWFFYIVDSVVMSFFLLVFTKICR